MVDVVSQANMVTNSKNWVVDSSATWYICANRDAFTSYTSVGMTKRLSTLVTLTLLKSCEKAKSC